MLLVFAARTGTAFPQDGRDQLEAAARAMARAWNARLGADPARGAGRAAGGGARADRAGDGAGRRARPGRRSGRSRSSTDGPARRGSRAGSTCRTDGGGRWRSASAAGLSGTRQEADARPALEDLAPAAMAELRDACARDGAGARRRLPDRLRDLRRQGGGARCGAGAAQCAGGGADRGGSGEQRRDRAVAGAVAHRSAQSGRASASADRSGGGARRLRRPGWGRVPGRRRGGSSSRRRRRRPRRRGTRTRSSCGSRPAPRTSAACIRRAGC